MSSTAAPVSPGPGPVNGSGPNVSQAGTHHAQQHRTGSVTSSYPPPQPYNYPSHYPTPPSGYPSAYQRGPPPPSGYAQPGPGQSQPQAYPGSYPNYSANGGGYARTGSVGYHQPTAGPSRQAPNGLSNLLHPDGQPKPRSPTQTPLSLPPIRPLSPSQRPNSAAPSAELSRKMERGASPPMPLDPALAEPEPDLPVNLPPPGAGPAQPRKRPFDDLLGATASLEASEGQHHRVNPAEGRDGEENGDMLAFIVKKAVQMTNKAKLTAEADEADSDDKGPGGPTKKFPCPHQLCGRKFARSWNLQAHLKSHLGIRDFSCPECGKLFSRKHDCTRHCIAIHLYNKDGTKPATTDNTNNPALAHAPAVPVHAPAPPPAQQNHQLHPNADLAVPAPAQ